ncbi:hypothetical protein OFN97_05555 [Campylobacter sp. VBCF_05 NA6]|uniref:type III-A CRISPR-associated protein Cas10/Csm1 n=1 Tax=unclassified Campylobacter TaxID=2593542 RepID=UPI0022E9F4E7|nr:MULTISPECIES: hypothetical protein [unclassified Campylobacter]MDA3057106.1 hypothetical protein [Campylobacter sp. VBCF_04 NA7]MDA3059480.1 hypothetical protein [Campylobacter sp. VBCF_05 NA6]
MWRVVMNKFDEYFNVPKLANFEFKKPQPKKSPFSDGDMWLISGDFYGIQKFIFEGLGTKNAAKVLRAKSAFIQLFSEFIAKYICEKLGISHDKIISLSAGKFEILSDKEPNLSEIKTKINEYFIKNFYGLSGVSVVSVKCDKSEFADADSFKNLRDKIAKEIEHAKFGKFDLAKFDNFALNYDENITNQTLCKICNIRKVSGENCDICDHFIALGQKLVSGKNEKISSENLGIKFDDFKTDLTFDDGIKSYVFKEENGEICEFENLAQYSCGDGENGVKAIGVLKADVDGMGNFIKDGGVAKSYENFSVFSNGINDFFSLFVPALMRAKFPHTYTIFGGGDDLLLVGAWDEIIALSREIKGEFEKFVMPLNKLGYGKLTISFGIVISKPSTPISYLAEISESLLEKSKQHIDDENKENDSKENFVKKNAITLFGESANWGKYLGVYKELMPKFENFANDDSLNTAFLYRLLEICEMSKKVKFEDDYKATMWKSKLSYAISRNQSENLQNEFYAVLDEKIEENPKETKMVISEFIYKRRKR